MDSLHHRRHGYLFRLWPAALAVTLLGVSSSSAEEDMGTTVKRLEARYETTESADSLPGDTADLETILRVAQRNSPRLRAAYYDLRAAVEKAGYAGSWDNPRLSWSYFVEKVETRVGPQEQRLNISQPLKWPGKLSARRDAALEAARAFLQRYEAERLRLLYRVKRAYYEYLLLEREIELTRENVELLRFWESVVRSRYKVGLQTHPDLIRAQMELEILDDRLVDLVDRRKPTAAALLAELNLPVDTELILAARLQVEPVLLDDDTLVARIVSHNPDLRAMDHLVSSEQAYRRQAARSSYPDFTVGLSYIVTGEADNPAIEESGKDSWMVNLGVSLPLWFGQNKARRREAQARYRAAQYRRESSADRLKAQATRLLAQYREAGRKVQLYGDLLLPQTEQLISANFAAYQAAELDFLSLLAAQRQLLEYSLSLDRSRATMAVTQAEIEMLSGHDYEE